MKPTKMRNQMIYRATMQRRSKQLSAHLSEDLHKKYGKRSVRVVEGDSVKILRGEYKGVDGKIEKISMSKNSVAVAGIKKEATKGEKYDVYIHTSNLIVTGLNTDDKWRIKKLEGSKGSSIKSEPKVTEKQDEKNEKTAKETKEASKETPKETEENEE